MRTRYVMGDIHGQKAALDRALALIEADGGPDAEVTFLGDYTDRGPDSRAVIETLMAGFAEGRNWQAIRGNHDRLFSRFYRNGTTMDAAIKSGIAWLNPRLGGNTTLRSYFDFPDHPRHNEFGQAPELESETQALAELARQHVPEAHITFLDSLPLSITDDGLFFAHAGVDPTRPLDDQDEEDLIWIREGWLDFTDPLPCLVVHGHTALEAPEHYGNRLNLDGGAGYFRPLVPVAIETEGDVHRVFTLDETGRTPLLPPH